MNYRRLIDKIKENTLTNMDVAYAKDILNRCANRESTPQFFESLPGIDEQYFLGRDEISNQDFLGLVKSYEEETNMVVLEERNIFRIGDTVEFFGPNLETFSCTLSKIYDEENNAIEVANHPGMIVKIPIPITLHEFDMMRLKVFDKLDYV